MDGRRLGLWGTSLGGGHVVQFAAERTDIRAVVAQVPFLGGEPAAPPGLAWIAEALWSAPSDGLRQALGGDPLRIPIVGRPDEFAVINAPRQLGGVSRGRAGRQRVDQRSAGRRDLRPG